MPGKAFLLAATAVYGPYEELPVGGTGSRLGERIYLYFADAHEPPLLVESGSLTLSDGTWVWPSRLIGVGRGGVLIFDADHYITQEERRTCLCLMRLETK